MLEGMDGFGGGGVFEHFAFFVGIPLLSVGEYPDDFDLVRVGRVDFEEHGVGLGFGLLESGLPDDAMGGELVDGDAILHVEDLFVWVDGSLVGVNVECIFLEGPLGNHFLDSVGDRI